jgi:uncharacterized BrkB/YihY/UPF0761 family membrane protein
MEKLVRMETWLVRKLNVVGGKYLKNAIAGYADYRLRHFNEPAAAISFYAIFSAFPLLAFTAYMVGVITGKADGEASASMVMNILTTFVPGIQGWIEKGLFAIVKGKAVHNFINGLLLAWAANGLFQAANSAIIKVPNTHKPVHKSYIENTFLGAVTLSLFVGLLATIIYTEYMSSVDTFPAWMLPIEIPWAREAALAVIKSGGLLACVGITFTGLLYYILIPKALKLRYALVGGVLFSALLVVSRSFYWVYLHYNKGTMESVYGAFTTLILIMLWVNFISNCFVFSGLYAYHLSESSQPQGKEHHQAA